METSSVGKASSANRVMDCLGLERRARVLIAEDDPHLLRLLAGTLEDSYDVAQASNGFELLDSATAGERPDLIISDIRMPGLTGLEVLAGLRSLKRIGARGGTPVILITAFGDAETHALAGRLGAVVLDKPFDLDDLRSCAVHLVGSVVRCAACGAPVAVIPVETSDGVWFCNSCQERSHLGDFPEVYVELGGGD